LAHTFRIGDLGVLLGALLVFGFSFAPFLRYPSQVQQRMDLDVSLVFNAWSLELFMVPLTTFVIMAAVLTAVSAVVRFALKRDPHIVGFRLRQLEVGTALFTAVVLFGMVSSVKHSMLGAKRISEASPVLSADASGLSLENGWGAIMMLISAFVLLVGTLLNHFEVGPPIRVTGGSNRAGPKAGGHPASPAGWQGAPSAPSGWQPMPPGGWQAAAPSPPGQGQPVPPPPAQWQPAPPASPGQWQGPPSPSGGYPLGAPPPQH
jgi:hypothetical protein